MFFRFFKRLFDIFSASLLLLIISPLFILLIILVKFNIGSPVFFTQERTGMHQKRFKLIKFRTMTNEKDENGNVTVVHGTYDPETKSGSGFEGRKVKGTIHWVAVPTAKKIECRLYENIVDEEKGVYNKEDGSLNVNPNSLTTVTAYVEPALMEAKGYDSFQFVRTGFFCADIHDSKEGAPVFNRIVSLKSSFKLPKA